MTDEQLQAGQEPEPTRPGQEPGTDDSAPEQLSAQEAKIEKVRQEAAKWRSQLRDAQTQLKELAPMAEEFQKIREAQKTDAEKAQERIAALEAEIAEKDAQAASMAAEAKLMRLAQQAGVEPGVVGLLDISKINLDDEETTLQTLGALAMPAKLSSMSNSGRDAQPDTTQDELATWYKNRGRTVTAFDQ